MGALNVSGMRNWVERHGRTIAYSMLLVLTVIGLHQFASGDPGAALAYWRSHAGILPAVCVLVLLDVILGGAVWAFTYRWVGIRSGGMGGVAVYLTGYAGLLLPAQLGRLVRPDAMTRLGRASLSRCMVAEGLCLCVDAVAAIALLAGLVVALVNPLLGVLLGVGVAAAMLLLGERLARLAARHTSLVIPTHFLRSRAAAVLVLMQTGGWIAHGLAFHLLVTDLTAEATPAISVLFTTSAALVGTGTGLPGGVGATEGLLGASLAFLHFPPAQLALTILGFRLLTFWIWVPAGWLALLAVGRASAAKAAKAPEDNAALSPALRRPQAVD